MKIPVERLDATPQAFEFSADTGWWRSAVAPGPGLPAELPEPFRIVLRGHRMGETDLLLEGTLTGWLELECGRCLARYRHAIREPFRLVLEPAGARAPSEPEAAQALARDGICLGEEIETGWYRGPEIELGPFFAELVSLSLPVQPLCRQDCAGLCSRCGADLNLGPCGCAETHGNSPFAVLQTLRSGRSGGED
jgi:uncharacterized protein